MDDERDITPLLQRAHEGDQEALEELARIVHEDLVRLANKLTYGRYGAEVRTWTLEPSALVNETFIKLLQQRGEYKNREHFFAIATKIMVRVLLDYHKSKKRQKRGRDQVRVSLSALGRDRAGAVDPVTDIPNLAAALEKLEALDQRAAKVVKLRALWGLNPAEVADVMGLSRSTIDREWRFARKWLAANLRRGG